MSQFSAMLQLDSCGPVNNEMKPLTLPTSDQYTEPRGLYLIWNIRGKALEIGQEEGKFHDTFNLLG